jgi:hypothetical protein
MKDILESNNIISVNFLHVYTFIKIKINLEASLALSVRLINQFCLLDHKKNWRMIRLESSLLSKKFQINKCKRNIKLKIVPNMAHIELENANR